MQPLVSSTILIGLACFAAAQIASDADPGEFVALGCPNTTKPYASYLEQLEAWTDFTELMYSEQRVADAFTKYAAINYINHSPLVDENGVNATVAHLTEVVSSATSELQRAYVGTDRNGIIFGTAHTHVSSEDGDSALVDIIRMHGTCLVEHWDVQQEVSGNEPNPIAFF